MRRPSKPVDARVPRTNNANPASLRSDAFRMSVEQLSGSAWLFRMRESALGFVAQTARQNAQGYLASCAFGWPKA